MDDICGIHYQSGRWNCAEVQMMHPIKYRQVAFQIESNIDSIDKNSVFGLFLYRDDTSEIDIEISRWGLDSNIFVHRGICLHMEGRTLGVCS